MRENRCFNCHQIGHRSKDCRSPKQNDNAQPSNEVGKYLGVKKTAVTARAMIRNLVADMDEEEKEKLWQDMNSEQDF